MKKIVKAYLHSDKSSMSNHFEEELELDFSDPILDKLKYALYEVEFDLEVDLETGDYEILKVDGMRLVEDD